MRAGDEVWNPLSGERAVFVETAEETDGARVVVDLTVAPGGFVPGGEHVHDHFSERMEIRGGRISFRLDGVERTLAEGDEVTVEPGTWHRWWNAGDDEVRIRGWIEPALHFEQALVTFWGLCADGHTNAKGTPSPLYGALVATRFQREIRFRPPPELVQRLAFPPLAALARRRGLDRAIERYLDVETHPTAKYTNSARL
jgi:quercetin dioxygenase-like cupin family protein